MSAEEIIGPLRRPVQMLADQEYGGHASIHDDAMAEKLGFRAGPIEGPTHFSQFVPLLASVWGTAWYERGCLSSHFQNMVVEGEAVRAIIERPVADDRIVRIRAEKEDGTPVLEGTASLGDAAGQHPDSELDGRRAALRPAGKLVILEDLRVGMKGRQSETVQMDFDQHMGALYPFSLRDKLARITENSPWYDPVTAATSPWGRAIIPLEMISVLAEYSSRLAGWPVKGPAVGLFADLEIRLLNGPLFVGETYRLEREIVALAESKRTESYWVRTRIIDPAREILKAVVVLNHATLKESYAGYAGRS
jgi:hypothetical protein